MDVEDLLRAQLNPAHYEAVTQIEGPVLVVAGAGTGKTRIIEYRVLSLAHEGYRGGVTTCACLSRFLDAPEIARRLDISGKRQIALSEGAGGIITDKEGLVQRVLNKINK